MPNKYTLKDRSGRVLGTYEANSQAEALELYKRSKTTLPKPAGVSAPAPSKSFLGTVWDKANESFLPEHKFDNKLGNFLYENVVRPTASPLGIATSGAWFSRPAGLALRAAKRGWNSATAANALTAAAGKVKKGNAIRRIADETKQMALTSGVPGTNISWHGLSLAASNAMATPLKEGGVIAGAVRSARALADQKYVQRELSKIASQPFKVGGQTVKTKNGVVTLADAAKKAGVTMDISGGGAARISEPLLTAGKYNPLRKMREVQEEVFDKPLFGEMVPLFKLQQFRRNYEALEKALPIANKRDAVKAMKAAGKSANLFFGGLGKNSTWNKNVAGAIFLAPDWYERHVKLGKEVFKALVDPKNPMGQAYRTFAGNMLTTLGVMDLANKTLSGKHLWENQSGKTFEIDTGKIDDKGRRVYFSPTAGALDFVRLPSEVIHGMVKEGNMGAVTEPVMNRLSTVVRFTMDVLGHNYKPNAFRHRYPQRIKEKGGAVRTEVYHPRTKQVGNVLEDFVDNMMPGWVQSAEDAFHEGDRDFDSSRFARVSKALELPFRFRKDAQPQTKSRAEVRRENRRKARERAAKRRQERR